MTTRLGRAWVENLRAEDRKALLDAIASMIEDRELTPGEALRVLRKAILGFDRARFARAVGVSVRAIAKLEDDPDANPTINTLSRVFAPFGLHWRPVPARAREIAPHDEQAQRRREAIRAALARTRRGSST